MCKTVLFVTYGGGHAQMVIPVMRELHTHSDIRAEALALTLAGPAFRRSGIPYKGFRDFIATGDEAAAAHGKRLAALHHNPQTGIEEQESIAYLGLSYWDLVRALDKTRRRVYSQSRVATPFFRLPSWTG